MEVKNMRFKEGAVDTGNRTFSGYASIFGNIDSYGDVVMKGAFTQTIKERASRIKVMYNHMWAIGKAVELEETDRGLWVKGFISDTPRGNEVLTLMNDGAIDEMSIGYESIKSDREQRDGKDVRLLREIKLYEFSPVDFAANDQAVITSVKSVGLLTGVELSDDQVVKIIDAIKTLKTESGDPLEESHIALDESVLELIARIDSAKTWAMHRLY